MSHHGWITPIELEQLTPNALRSPFGRLFPVQSHSYSSHAIAMLSGALGPLDPTVPPTGNARRLPTGFTFLGQFIDHDLTEFRVVREGMFFTENPVIGDRQKVLEDTIDGELPTATNGRSGGLDLDSVYGLFGTVDSNLFDKAGSFRMREDRRDIARGKEHPGERLIADLRNDENKIIVQVHLLFERLHNLIHRAKPGDRWVGSQAFAETRASVVATYRRIVLNDYLPAIVGMKRLDDVMAHFSDPNPNFYKRMNARSSAALVRLGADPAEADIRRAMPVEFSHAVFRLGHSQLREGYRLNGEHEPRRLFATNGGRQDLRGREALTKEVIIDWRFFFPIDAKVELGQPIDADLPHPIFRLPPPAIGEPPISLPERNIRRAVDFGLPSGQQCAAALAAVYGPIRVLSNEELFPNVANDYAEILEIEPKLATATPLWYYMLREAEQESGPELGPVGGYVVAETILGSLASEPGFDLAGEHLKLQNAGRPPLVAPPGGIVVPASVEDIRSMAELAAFLVANDA